MDVHLGFVDRRLQNGGERKLDEPSPQMDEPSPRGQVLRRLKSQGPRMVAAMIAETEAIETLASRYIAVVSFILFDFLNDSLRIHCWLCGEICGL